MVSAYFITGPNGSSQFDGPAELPRYTVDTTFPTVTGSTWNVNDQTSADSAFNATTGAVGGDVIVITGSFTGTINLPNRAYGDSRDGWILVRSDNSAWASNSETRVTTNTNMRAITAAGSPLRAITTSTAAHHYYFCGIELKMPSSGAVGTTLCAIGNAEVADANLPSYIIFDRCYVHGDATNGGRRGFHLDGKNCAVINSSVFDWKEVGPDTQTILAINTPGPLLIENNYLEASAEGFMFGGGDSSLDGRVPSDITIRKNYIKKPIAWFSESWTVKNGCESKMSKRVLFERNVIENVWKAGQVGAAMNMKTENQDGGSGDWAETSNWTIRYNKFIKVEVGFQLSALGDNGVIPMNTLSIHDNIVEVEYQAGDAKPLQILGNIATLSFKHNTMLILVDGGTSAACIMDSATPATGFDFQNNIVSCGSVEWKGSGYANGKPSMDQFWGTYTFTKNASIGAVATYPAGNFSPANVAAVQFVNYAGGDYTLDSGSPYKGAGSDGLDLGCSNVALVESYAAAAISGA